jgi:predicted permease
MSTLIQDLRYTVRALRRAPGFTLVVVLTLGAGIGANTAIFSLLDQVLLRSIPVERPEELVQLDNPGTFSGRTDGDRTFSYPMYVDFRDRNTVLAGLVARFSTAGTLAAGQQAERIDIELVSGNTFQVLGVQAALGRALTPDDDRTPGAHPVAVLSHSFWQRRFASDPAIVGRTVRINATPMTIVGVAPRGFAGVMSATAADVFVPVMMKAQMTPTWNELDFRRSRWLSLVGRLKPGVTTAQAKASLDVLYRQINEHELVAVPEFAAASQRFKDRYRAKTLVLHDASIGLSDVRGDFSTPLTVLMGMVGLVLLIASANVANLLLSRATARQKEMAMRLALGASRWRLIRQMLTESLVLASAGAFVGVIFAAWLGELLLAALPFDGLSQALSTSPDLRVGLFTAVVALATAILFGLAPALQSARLELTETMRDSAGSLSGGVHHARFRKSLVVAQVALSVLLVAGGGLFARSLYNLQQLDRGFDTDRIMTFSLNPSWIGYDQASVRRFSDTLLTEVRALPGVTTASLARLGVLTGSSWRRTISVAGYTPRQDEDMSPNVNEVSGGYFGTMHIPLLAGREFTERDTEGAPSVAIVNETFVKYFFPNQNPLGRRFGWSSRKNPQEIEIVGVVKDSLYFNARQGTTAENATPRFVYIPYPQGTELGAMNAYVRADAIAAAGLGERLRQTVRRIDPGLPVASLQWMDTTVERALFTERMLARLSAAFGLLATLLATVGLYGVMSYTVSRRTREIGIRIALGAERRSVLWLVQREVIALALVGVTLGVPAALALSRLVESQLVGVSANDPLTIGGAAAFLALVSLVAGWLPARRAARVEPLRALRYE